MWRIVPAGVSTHETVVLADADGFRAALCSSSLDLKHEHTRRTWRTSLLAVRGFARHGTGLAVFTQTETVHLPDVSVAFAEAMVAEVSALLPGGPAIDVVEADLRDAPTHYHRRIVRVLGHHTSELEGSRFAGAWLTIPEELGVAVRSGHFDVEGLFLSDPEKHAEWRGTRGYGHMGMSPAELIAYRYTRR